MKLKIDKGGPGMGSDVRVEFTPDGKAAAPVKLTLDRQRLEMLLGLLETARKADRFAFELEL